MQESVAQKLESCLDTATELVHGDAVLCGILRGYKVCHGLSLRKVHLAVHEGALRELTRCSHLASGINEQRENLLLYVSRAMTGNLHRVLAGIGMRCAEDGEYDVIEGLSPRPPP